MTDADRIKELEKQLEHEMVARAELEGEKAMRITAEGRCVDAKRYARAIKEQLDSKPEPPEARVLKRQFIRVSGRQVDAYNQEEHGSQREFLLPVDAIEHPGVFQQGDDVILAISGIDDLGNNTHWLLFLDQTLDDVEALLR